MAAMTDPGVAPDERRTPAEWQPICGIRILDPDGWRGALAKDWDEPVTRAEFMRRVGVSTIGPWADPASTPAVRLADETIGQLHARLAEVIAERDRLLDANAARGGLDVDARSWLRQLADDLAGLWDEDIPEVRRRVAMADPERLYAVACEVDRLTAERDRLIDAIRDIDAHATPFGLADPEDPDGNPHHYVLTVGALHRALGAAEGRATAAKCGAEAALERVRACLLMGGQSAAFRAQAALAALSAPADAGGGGADG